jgi:hypothetical protein
MCCSALCPPWSHRLAAPAHLVSAVARLEAGVSGHLYTRNLMREPSQSMNATVVPNSSHATCLQDCGHLAWRILRCFELGDGALAGSACHFAAGSVRLCSTQATSARQQLSMLCPVHTCFEQSRCLRRVVHGSRFSHVTGRNAKGPSSPLFLARSSWTTNSMENKCCTDTR